MMDDLGFEAWIDLGTAIEQAADWPGFATNLASIPNTDGGLRPIALLAAVVRAHGRLRRPIMAVWEE